MVSKEKSMENLIIHPQDASTKFLEPCYNGIINKKVIRKGMTPSQLHTEISQHERVLMMGHGCSSGLFAVNQFVETAALVIDKGFSGLLVKQSENIYVWCHADQFVLSQRLSGFFTGMFISEVYEAVYCGLENIKQQQVDESNQLFSSVFAEVAEMNKHQILKRLLIDYGQLARHNPVAAYNVKRMYVI